LIRNNQITATTSNNNFRHKQLNAIMNLIEKNLPQAMGSWPLVLLYYTPFSSQNKQKALLQKELRGNSIILMQLHEN